MLKDELDEVDAAESEETKMQRETMKKFQRLNDSDPVAQQIRQMAGIDSPPEDVDGDLPTDPSDDDHGDQAVEIEDIEEGEDRSNWGDNIKIDDPNA